MKKISILVLMIVGLTVALSAQTDDKKKASPVKVGLSYSAQYHYDTLGDNAGKNRGEADQYIRNEATADFGFDIFKNDSIKLTGKAYIKDRFDIKFGTTTVVTDVVAVPAKTAKIATVIPRNRLYLGYTWGLDIVKMIQIGLEHEFRLENDLTKTGAVLRISPAVLSISSKAKELQGFSFSVKQLAGIHLNLSPASRVGKDKKHPNIEVFEAVELEGTYQVAFEFLHFIPDNKDIKGSFYVKDYLNILLHSADVKTQSYIKYNDITVGLEFDFFKVKPRVALLVSPLAKVAETKSQYAVDSGYAAQKALKGSSEAFVGFETGVSFSKEWFSIGVTYQGRSKVYNKDTDGKETFYDDFFTGLEGQTLAEAQLKAWQSHVEVVVGFKL